MKLDTLKIIGHINLKLYDENGLLKEERDLHNLVVTAGKNALAAWLASATQADYFMKYIALGTGVTAPVSTDTTLQSELATRVVGNITSSTNIWQNQATFGAGVNTGALTEAGLFSASSGGTMFARQVFPVVNKASGDSIVFTWQVSIS
jgi:hypothetical protein